MELDKIGFYTLSEDRCRNASERSAVSRSEIVLTDACNFKCTYCRGQRSDLKKRMSLEEAKAAVDSVSVTGCRAIRFSGGEPTVWPHIVEIVRYAAEKISAVAISTNGSAPLTLYQELIDAGANDFSVSLDSCCSSEVDKLAGSKGKLSHICDAIEYLSSRVYTTAGVVVTPDNLRSVIGTIDLAHSLGVSDIRIIPAAQWCDIIDVMKEIPQVYLNKYPILRYRVSNTLNRVGVRGIKETDSDRCGIAIDDIAIAGDYHFPCIIYLREQGDPIGKVGPNMRHERAEWSRTHDTLSDPICKKNCLDCIVQYNKKFADYRRHLPTI